MLFSFDGEKGWILFEFARKVVLWKPEGHDKMFLVAARDAVMMKK
jgi:hypothetical protein